MFGKTVLELGIAEVVNVNGEEELVIKDSERHRVSSCDEANNGLKKSILRSTRQKKVVTERASAPVVSAKSANVGSNNWSIMCGAKGDGDNLSPLYLMDMATITGAIYNFQDDKELYLEDTRGLRVHKPRLVSAESGSISGHIFFEDWIKGTVVQSYIDNGNEQALKDGIIILFDGHSCHKDELQIGALAEYEEEMGYDIRLVLRPPNTTGYTQNEDVKLFQTMFAGPYGGLVGQEIRKIKDTTLSLSQQLRVVQLAVQGASSRPDNIRAFAKTGFIPYNPKRVLKSPDFERLAFKNNQDFESSLYLTKPTAYSAMKAVVIPYFREGVPWSRVLNCEENVANIRSHIGSLKDKANAIMDRLDADPTLLYSQLKKADLAILCRAFAQTVSGNKADLVARIKKEFETLQTDADAGNDLKRRLTLPRMIGGQEVLFA